jgi:very-short-patch-repair endonuclease
VTVLRFWNDEVRGRPEVVLQAILDAIEEGRSGGGGG